MLHLVNYIDRITALILIVGCLILISCGIDSEMKSVLTMASGWLFGSSFVKLHDARAAKPPQTKDITPAKDAQD